MSTPDMITFHTQQGATVRIKAASVTGLVSGRYKTCQIYFDGNSITVTATLADVERAIAEALDAV